jgi:multidrug efflux pump subunit AcrA (membrane-fusion protein)
MRIQRSLILLLLCGGLLAAADAPTVKTDESASLPDLDRMNDGKLWGNTKPSERAEMSLASRSSDVVLDVKVKKGDVVKPGQVLAVLDTREEEAELKTTELMANSEVAILAAEVTVRQKDLEVRRMADAKGNVFTQLEIDKAKLDLDLAQLDIEKAQVDQQRYKYQAEQLRTQISRKQLVSRINGVVREINIEKGAVVDPQKPAIIVVNNTPLWVEVKMPIEMSLRLIEMNLAHKKLDFGVMLPGAKTATPANVIFIDPEADPAGRSQRWVLELPNSQQVASGIRVQVIPPQMEKVADAKVK